MATFYWQFVYIFVSAALMCIPQLNDIKIKYKKPHAGK